jgi:hypothetical protein
MNIPNDLLDFLDRNDLTQKFMANADELFHEDDELVADLFAFMWAAAPEGEEYWREVHQRFIEEQEQTRIVDFTQRMAKW